MVFTGQKTQQQYQSTEGKPTEEKIRQRKQQQNTHMAVCGPSYLHDIVRVVPAFILGMTRCTRWSLNHQLWLSQTRAKTVEFIQIVSF